MKQAFVSGADGFIGSHLVELLLQSGYKVRALSQYNSFNHWGWLEELDKHENLDVVSGDIRDSGFITNACKDIDIIFHLASLIAIPYSYVAPQSYVETNIIGTLNICQASQINGNIRVLHTSTSEVYGTAKYIPIDEDHPKQPQSPYSATKIGADALAASFYNSYNTPITIVRPFNTYGPRQSARAIIPSVISQILSGKKKIKVGSLTPTRDFNYVADTCEGFLAIAKNEECIGKEINIASCSEISMKEALNEIRTILNKDVEFIEDPNRIRPKRSEVQRLYGDNSKIRSLTDWEPRTSLRSGLEKTCKWFSIPENLKKYKTELYNI